MTIASDSVFSTGSILLCTAALGRDGDDDCIRWLSCKEEADRNVLLVTYNRAPKVVYDHWESHVGEEPTELGIISVGGGGARTGTHRLEPRGDSNAISLASPASLGRLETTIHLYLDQWSANDGKTVLCFDSISSSLRHVDRTAAFRFLHSLTEYLRQQNVLAHFHIDPDLHDDATIAMLCSLFDAVHGRSGDVENVSADVLLALLGTPRRRLVCRYLVEIADRAPISAIARRIAEWEGSGTASENERERVHITLHHVHLPELADAGVLERDGEMVSSTVESGTLDRYVRLTADDSSPEVPPALPNRESIRPSDSSVDESDETYWTVYGTAPDSIAVTLARALGDVQNTNATELRPVLADVIDIDALQRLSDHGDVSVYAAFEYEGYEVVVDSGEIKLYESR
ncbi:HalOD1 output domain-containing protein [Haladaptatus sp. DYF46]|uniref:DUF7504 family protein n=1 Tax=Haladaptatus sp. DYF46 TaxID=2886041 RepID=UPI001E50B203|nr:HalOD1 output domain-containing protein [Haladaptatus sp. DYF46]